MIKITKRINEKYIRSNNEYLIKGLCSLVRKTNREMQNYIYIYISSITFNYYTHLIIFNAFVLFIHTYVTLRSFDYFSISLFSFSTLDLDLPHFSTLKGFPRVLVSNSIQRNPSDRSIVTTLHKH